MIVHVERLNGLKSSTLIFVFWCILALTSIVTLRSHILNYHYQVTNLYFFSFFSFQSLISNNLTVQTADFDRNELIVYFVYFTLLIVNIILAAFTETRGEALVVDDDEQDGKKAVSNQLSCCIIFFTT